MSDYKMDLGKGKGGKPGRGGLEVKPLIGKVYTRYILTLISVGIYKGSSKPYLHTYIKII